MIDSIKENVRSLPSPGETTIRNPARLSIRSSAIETFASLENLHPDTAATLEFHSKNNSYSPPKTLTAQKPASQCHLDLAPSKPPGNELRKKLWIS